MDKLTKERFKYLALALKLQAKEYKRRLKVLNGEGDRIKEILKESVTRELFDKTVEAMSEKNDDAINNTNNKFDRITNNILEKIDKIVEDQVKPLIVYQTKQEGSMLVLKWLIGIAVAILIGIVISMLTRKA